MSRRLLLAAAAAIALVAGACGSGDGDASDRAGGGADPSTSTTAQGKLEAQVASYDLVAGPPQRLLIGLVASEGRVVTGGEIEVFFAHLGAGSGSSATGTLGAPHRGTFQPIAGSKATAEGPRLARPSEGVGVYAVRDAVFDKPGRWGLLANVEVGGAKARVQGVFQVGATTGVLRAGDAAPRTANPLPGSPGVTSAAVDSRAQDGEAIPDAALHTTTVADALAAKKPTVVVVSTPVYCVSRFCGPITDSVEKLAADFGDRAAFVHLEVWQDFEKKQANTAAGEWIYRENRGDLLEPWVFVVDRNGIVAERFDNIAGDDELRRAVEGVLG